MRARGEGSVYAEGDAWRWEIRLPDGRRRRGRAATKELAAKGARNALRDAEDGVLASGRAATWTVQQWVEHVIATSDLAPKTRESYESNLRRLLAPLHDVRLVKLSPERVERWLAGLRADPRVSSQSALHGFRLLSRAMTVAAQRRLIVVSPCATVAPPRVQKATTSPLTLDEARRVLAACAGTRDEARWGVAIALGLRQGEALGLRVDDVDLEAGTLIVAQQVQRHAWKHGCVDAAACGAPAQCPARTGGGLVVVPRTKSRAVRTIALPTPLVDLLRVRVQQRRLERVAAGARWQESGLLFCTKRGRPTSPSDDWRAWKALLEVAGVPHRRLHDARHTTATLHADMGTPMHVTQETLGHSDIALTAGVYVHVMDGARRAAAAGMGAALWSPKV